MTHKLLKRALVVLLSVVSISIDAQEKPVLWYDKPAQYWEEALPLGNGRLGAMVYGNPAAEEIQLNEETVSAGSPYKNYNPEAKGALATIRQLIFAGRYPEAQELAGEKILSNVKLLKLYLAIENTLYLCIKDKINNEKSYRLYSCFY